jgi:c(7)-type cytochrome triheme protein
MMKLDKKIFFVAGLAACAALLYSVAGAVKGAPVTDEEYDEDLYGPAEMVVWNKPVPRVTFSHKVHTMDLGFECDSCHDDLFEMEAGAAQENEDFTMAGFADGKYCGACHDGSTAFHTSDPDMCAACHTPPGTIVFTKPVKAVVFDHKMHVDDYGFDCTSCHSDVFKMKIGSAETQPDEFIMEALYKGQYCGACHDGDTAFASDTRCTVCHIGVKGFNRLFGDATKEKQEGGH